jgi:glycosyltransferase involved in cell wall biosynthesis
MSPIRVAFDVGPLHGRRTGIGVAVGELASALGDVDDVELAPYLLSFRTRPDPPARRLPVPAAAAHRLWARIDHPRVDRFLGAVDVVHGTNYVVPPSRRPRLVSVYDVWFLLRPDLAAPAVGRAAAVLRRSVRSGAVVVASSAATAERTRELLRTDRVEVVHLGPPRASSEPARRPSWATTLGVRPFALALGTIERRKNLPALLASFGAAAGAVPELELVLAGADGDDSPAVTAAVAALPPHVRARVHRPGAVDAGAKAWLLGAATMLAYPSLDEGFGFPLLEAQQAGLPVVATRAGSIPEVGGDGVELVPLGDADALADALVRVATDDRTRARLIAAGTANLDRFSWAATAAATADLYRRTRDGDRQP